MEYLPALFLGVIQGVTEFLPVSSSGHLALFQQLFSMDESALSYDLFLHFATMGATVLFFGKDIASLFREWSSGFLSSRGRRTEGWTLGWAVAAGTVATGVLGLSLKPLVRQAMTLPAAVAAGLLVTAALLWYGSNLPSRGEGRPLTLRTGILVGLIQGVAVLPGISRSGSTIVGGMKSGMSPLDAFRFSFLLSLPAIFGATLLEVRELMKMDSWRATLPPGWMAGVILAFLTGLAALALLRRLVSRGQWKPFALYCALLGGVILALPLFRGTP